MQITIEQALYYVVFAPLVGCLLAGILGKPIGRHGAHWATIIGMLVSFAGALFLGDAFLLNDHAALDLQSLYLGLEW